MVQHRCCLWVVLKAIERNVIRHLAKIKHSLNLIFLFFFIFSTATLALNNRHWGCFWNFWNFFRFIFLLLSTSFLAFSSCQSHGARRMISDETELLKKIDGKNDNEKQFHFSAVVRRFCFLFVGFVSYGEWQEMKVKPVASNFTGSQGFTG